MGAIDDDGRADPGWTCATCGARRPALDAFCGACGASSSPAAVPRDSLREPSSGSRPVLTPAMRTAILGAVLLVAVAAAVLIGGGSEAGPGRVAVDPATWRCDGAERAWTAAIPASAPELVIELHDGGVEGRVVVATPASRDALATYRQPDGTYRVTSSDPAAPECGVPAGRYVLVIRDAGSGDRVASGEVVLAP